MKALGQRWMKFLIGLPAAVAMGTAIGVLTNPRPAMAEDCEYNVCDTEEGDCTTTDIRYSCKEVSGGCESTECSPLPD